jgi:hypothetical protein
VAEESSGTGHCNLAMSGRYAPPQRHQKDIEMQQKLTDVTLRALKAPMESRIEISNTERVGLRFRLTSSNKATWLYQKQIKGGARRGFTLGSYSAMSLAQARAEALAIQLEAESGIDRVAAQEALRVAAAAEALTARTVKDILDLYILNHIEQELKPGQAREERKRQLLRYLGPHFTRRIDDVSRADIQKIIDTKQAEGRWLWQIACVRPSLHSRSGAIIVVIVPKTSALPFKRRGRKLRAHERLHWMKSVRFGPQPLNLAISGGHFSGFAF